MLDEAAVFPFDEEVAEAVRLPPAELATLAVTALIEEAELTPKPGLVDRRGSGAHHDLDLQTMLSSARALGPTFLRLAVAGRALPPGAALRTELARIGRDGERVMLEATGGINTHRGAIWALGLLIAATAGAAAGTAPDVLCRRAGSIACHPDRAAPPSTTHGASACARYGVGGARAQATAGFPHVRRLGLRTLLANRRCAMPEHWARIDALLSIMSELDDTCLLHRGGPAALAIARGGAAAVLDAGGASTAAGRAALRGLDRELVARHVSPGGSADLLAATLLLDRLGTAGPVRRFPIEEA